MTDDSKRDRASSATAAPGPKMRGYFGIGVEGISKPMNLGAVLRTAHAFNASFAFSIKAEFDIPTVLASDTSVAFNSLPVQLYDTVDNMLLDLTSKRVDLVFAGPIKLANDFLDKPRGKGYKFIGPEINDVKYFGPGVGIGLRKDDAGLRDELDKAMKAMIDDGTFKTINDKYWSFSVLPASN